DQFFGDSSIASFLRQIQDSAENETVPFCLPNIAAQSFSAAPTPKAVDLPPRELADYLLDCYYEKIHTLYPFFHRPAFARAYSALWAPGPTTDANDFGKRIGLGDPSVPWPIFHAGLNIILALGCQFSSLDRMTREATADAFFQRSQRFLNGISMDKGSLALVQTLLLMSSYLQGSESPARASSMMLGRPPMIQDSAVPLPDAIDDEALDQPNLVSRLPPTALSRTEFYVRTLQLYQILRQILARIFAPWEGRQENLAEQPQAESSQARNVMELEVELLAFKSGLPVELNWQNGEIPANTTKQYSRESCLLRARFLQYRILLLRPTLIRFCRQFRVSHAAALPEASSSEMPSEIFRDFRLSCSINCVKAAIELIHLMNDTSTTELASVWWYSVFYTFSAGIVLALARTCSAIKAKFAEQTLEDSWKSCSDCLEKMSSLTKSAEIGSQSLNKVLSLLMQAQHDPFIINPAVGQEHRLQPQSQDMHCEASATELPVAPAMDFGDPLGLDDEQRFLGMPGSDIFTYLLGEPGLAGSMDETMGDELWPAAPLFL
ncbi:hypothetical protein BO99DRAFT_303803, partial [Aspergillus violaceofuscus CBS 115571]